MCAQLDFSAPVSSGPQTPEQPRVPRIGLSRAGEKGMEVVLQVEEATQQRTRFEARGTDRFPPTLYCRTHPSQAIYCGSHEMPPAEWHPLPEDKRAGDSNCCFATVWEEELGDQGEAGGTGDF